MLHKAYINTEEKDSLKRGLVMGLFDKFKKKKDDSSLSAAPAAPDTPPVAPELDAPPMPPPELKDMIDQSPQMPDAESVQEPNMGSPGSMPELPSFEDAGKGQFDLGDLPEFPQMNRTEAEQPAKMPTAFQADDTPEDVPQDLPTFDDEEKPAPQSPEAPDLFMPQVDEAREELSTYQHHDPKGPSFVDVDRYKTIMHNLNYMQDDVKECISYYDQHKSLQDLMDTSYDQFQDALMQMQRKLMLMDKILFER
jgi:hypothetical protein